MARVSLENIVKTYSAAVRAVDGVNLDIADREFVVLVGPSGCGKTTTLRMIAGLEELTSGRISIGDRVVNDVPPKDRDIAMVFQNYALYPHMTVYKNMAFGLKLRGMPKSQIKQKVTETAKLLEIDHLLDRRPKELSGGQRQRVAVGRAIVREPVAFLFDEPLSNLDAKLRVSTRAEIKRLHQRLRTTTIYVTHDQEEAMTLGDRIVVMKDGRILQADTPLRVYHEPINRFVAGFIGTPPMNFIDGSLEAEGERLIFRERRPGRELTLAGNGFTLLVPEHLQGRLAARVSQPIVLGIRPRLLQLQPSGSPQTTGQLKLKVEVVEPLGSDMDVIGQTALGHNVVARLEAVEMSSGASEVNMYFDLRKTHFFEPGETGMNLSLTQGATTELNHALA
jgi:multiple sugar transport system ATP-binding protein